LDEYILKQLESIRQELKAIKQERDKYVKILENRKQEELSKENSIEEELASTPTYLSQFVRKKIVALSKEDNLSINEQRLKKDLDKAVDYLIRTY
jgi:hypothetical protein